MFSNFQEDSNWSGWPVTKDPKVVHCPPHLPREYRCNNIYLHFQFIPLRRYRSLKSSISCASYPAQIPIRCQCRGLKNIGTESDPCVSTTRYEGVIEGGNCSCPDQTPQDEIFNGWPIVRLTCCGKRRPTNDVKLVHIPIWD